MHDLIKLNRRIAAHWLGNLDAEQEVYLRYASACLAQFPHSVAALDEVLAREKQEHHNGLPVAKLNRQYLRFARLAAKDVAAGKLEMLVRLGLTLEQVRLLGSLSNEAVNRLAFGWQGEIIQFASHAFVRGAALDAHAAQHHATAFVATRLPAESEM